MSSLNWQWPLTEAETLLWQGRPAPRCYTFRHWKLAAAGTALFLVCSFWLFLGLQLTEFTVYRLPLLLVTVPLVVATFLLGPGQLLLARWRWDNIYYALTDQRLLLRDGLLRPQLSSYPSATISAYQQKRFGEQLASVRILRGKQPPLVIACIEYPQNLTRHLPARAAGSGGSGGDSV